MSMMDIARLAPGTTQKEVRYALANAGITPLRSGANRRPIPLSWLQDHYVGSGKRVAQAAAEAGVCRNTFAKYARLHNIPTTEYARVVNRTHDEDRSAVALGIHGNVLSDTCSTPNTPPATASSGLADR